MIVDKGRIPSEDEDLPLVEYEQASIVCHEKYFSSPFRPECTVRKMIHILG